MCISICTKSLMDFTVSLTFQYIRTAFFYTYTFCLFIILYQTFYLFICLLLFILFLFVCSPESCSSSSVSSECQHSDVSSRTTTVTSAAGNNIAVGVAENKYATGVQNYNFGSVLSGEELYIEVGFQSMTYRVMV